MLSIPRILSVSCFYFVACAFPLVYCCFPCLPSYSFLPLVCFPSLYLTLYLWFPHLSSFYSLACMLSFSLYSVSPFFCMYFSSLIHFPHLTVCHFLSIDYSYPLILAFTSPLLGALSLPYAAVFLPSCADLETLCLICVFSCSVT